jgi:hypothetical protein
MLYNLAMRACKSWGLALFIVLSVTAFFITPGAADDIDAVSQTAHVQLIAVDTAPSGRPSAILIQATRPRISSTHSSQRETPDLLNLICVRLC